jgi:hypothetical protein
MRVRPTATLALVIFAGYFAYFVAWSLLGVGFDEIADFVGNEFKETIIPLGIASILLALVAYRFGWWGAAIREKSPAGPRWLLVAPALMLLIALLLVVENGFGGSSFGYLVVFAIGVCLVGFSEELLFRGLMLVGFRGSLPEVWVWLFTTLLFGLAHFNNAISGQDLGETMNQVVFAFGLGSVLYLIRRVTATLIVCIALHAIWDFAATMAEGGGETGLILLIPLAAVTVYGLIRVLREPGPGSDEAAAIT